MLGSLCIVAPSVMNVPPLPSRGGFHLLGLLVQVKFVFRRICQIAAAVLGMAGLLAIIQYFPQPRYSKFWDCFFDTGHILVFGLFMLFALRIAALVGGDRRLAAQYWIAGGVSLLIGCAVEIWQASHERSAEWIDVFSDAVGVIAFAAIHAALDHRIPQPRPTWLARPRLLFVAILLIAIGCYPLMRVSYRYHVRNDLLPQLIDFEQPWHRFFYHVYSGTFSAVAPPAGWPTDEPTTVGRFELEPGEYPGFVFREPHPDWSAYRYLEMEVFSQESMPRAFVLRIHDYGHDNDPYDRFRGVVTLHPGYQILRVDLNDVESAPRGRLLSLRDIEAMVLYTTNLPSRFTFYVGRIRLMSEVQDPSVGAERLHVVTCVHAP